MLIQIKDETIELAISNGAPLAVFDAIENLLRAFRDGNHAILISPDKARQLLSCSSLSAPARGALQKLRSRWSELAGLQRSLPVRIEVGVSQSDPIASQPNTSTTVIDTHYELFSSSNKTHACTLICENLADAEFYIGAARTLITSKRWHLSIAAELHNGGGATTADVFQEQCKTGRVVLCVVDSDKRHPTGGIGPTATSVLQVSPVMKFQKALVLSCRNIENTFPERLVTSALASNPSNTPKLEAYSKLCTLKNNHSTSPLSYVNLKHGIRGRERLTQPDTHPEKTYWTAILNSSSIQTQNISCKDSPRCPRTEDCSCIIMDGVGPRLLATVIDFMRNTSPHKIAEIMSPPFASPLDEIAETVFAWCCSLEKFRT